MLVSSLKLEQKSCLLKYKNSGGGGAKTRTIQPLPALGLGCLCHAMHAKAPNLTWLSGRP